MKITFLLIIGLPGSGKTTLAKNLIKTNWEINNLNFIHICFDELIQFPNSHSEFEWKSARNSVLVKVERLIVALKNNNFDTCPLEFINQWKLIKNWNSDFVVIIDDNMYYKSMRYSVFQVAKKLNIGFSQVYINCTLENALAHNPKRETKFVVPGSVIENIHSKMEIPTFKNFWEKYSLILDAFSNFSEAYNQILLLINNCLNNYNYTENTSVLSELSKTQCKKSILHQADIALRKIVSSKIKKYLNENSKTECKNFLSELNSRKSELLSDIKTGNICLPGDVINEIDSDAPEKFQLIKFLNNYI